MPVQDIPESYLKAVRELMADPTCDHACKMDIIQPGCRLWGVTRQELLTAAMPETQHSWQVNFTDHTRKHWPEISNKYVTSNGCVMEIQARSQWEALCQAAEQLFCSPENLIVQAA